MYGCGNRWQRSKPDLEECKRLKDYPIPVIYFAGHCLLDVPQSNAQQGQWLMWVQPEGMEVFPQGLTLSRLHDHTKLSSKAHCDDIVGDAQACCAQERG